MEAAEPTMRNSNLLPVNANGEVRFLSVLSFFKAGSTLPLSFNSPSSAGLYSTPASMAFSTLVSSVPKNIDTIAGGASLAPRRWSLPALATLMRRRS